MTRSLSIAHLTFLHLTPPELIKLAGASGFDAVGLRLIAVTDTTPGYALMDDPNMMRDTLAAMRDTGVMVNDIEFVRLTPNFDAGTFEPFLEAGAKLGARHIVTAPYDPDHGRLTDNLGAFSDLAAGYNMTPVLEFFPWTSVPNLSSALDIVKNTGRNRVGVLLDTLHFNRSDSTLQQIANADPARFPFVHVCDADVQPSYTEDDLLHTARAARLMPGDGDIPLRDILSHLPNDVPIGLEVPLLRDTEKISDIEIAREMFEKTTALCRSLI
jgi:sugar phosphate isomerase/epimerase